MKCVGVAGVVLWAGVCAVAAGCGGPSGVPVKKLGDLEKRFVSSDNYQWKVLVMEVLPQPTEHGWEGRVRLEGPEGHVFRPGGVFLDLDCQARVVGEALELQFLGYRENSRFAEVKLFTIVNSRKLKCRDPNMFPGVMQTP